MRRIETMRRRDQGRDGERSRTREPGCGLRFFLLALLTWSASAALPRAAQAAEDIPPARMIPPAETAPERRGIPVLSVQSWLFPMNWSVPGLAPIKEVGNLRVQGLLGGEIEALDTIVAGSVQYDLTDLGFSSELPRQQHLFHGLDLRLAVLPQVAPRWRLNFFAVLGLASDYQAFATGDLRVTAGAGAVYTHSPDLQIQFGAMYSTATFMKLVLPLLAIDYRHGPWHLKFDIPKGGACWYALTDDVEVGVHIRVVNLRYNSHTPSDGFREITVLNFPAGPSFRWSMWQGLYLLVEGGYNLLYSNTITDQGTHEKLSPRGYQASLGLGYMI